MFILDESEIYYMSDIRKLLEQDRLECEADQKIKNLDNIVQTTKRKRRYENYLFYGKECIWKRYYLQKSKGKT